MENQEKFHSVGQKLRIIKQDQVLKIIKGKMVLEYKLREHLIPMIIMEDQIRKWILDLRIIKEVLIQALKGHLTVAPKKEKDHQSLVTHLPFLEAMVQ